MKNAREHLQGLVNALQLFAESTAFLDQAMRCTDPICDFSDCLLVRLWMQADTYLGPNSETEA